jgi:flavin-binding protein dodecin
VTGHVDIITLARFQKGATAHPASNTTEGTKSVTLLPTQKGAPAILSTASRSRAGARAAVKSCYRKELSMSDMLKVVEILAESNKSWEDAAQNAVKRAAETLKDIKSIYVQNFEAAVSKDQITKYRINAKISFLLEKKSK